MIKRVLLVTSCLMFLNACSDDDSGSGSSSNAITSGYSTVLAKANQITNLKPEVSFLGEGQMQPMASASFGSLWTTNASPFVDERDNTTTNPKEWMGIQLDADAVRANGSLISMFGRLNSALSIFCALGVTLGSDQVDSDGYPIDGSPTLTFTSSITATITSDCDMSDANDLVGLEIALVVTTPSSTTTYAKKVVMTFPAEMGGGSQTYYIKSDSTAINIATTEVNENGVHRTIVAYDVASEVLKLEYVSAPDGAIISDEHVAAYRLYSDEANDVGYMMALEHTEGSPDDIITYTLGGKPATTNAQFSLSMMSNGLAGTDPYEACVNSSNGDIATDGARCTASSTTVAGYDISTATAVNNFVSTYVNTNYDDVNESTALTFTTSDFDTAVFSQD